MKVYTRNVRCAGRAISKLTGVKWGRYRLTLMTGGVPDCHT
jgi:hypothetical protein